MVNTITKNIVNMRSSMEPPIGTLHRNVSQACCWPTAGNCPTVPPSLRDSAPLSNLRESGLLFTRHESVLTSMPQGLRFTVAIFQGRDKKTRGVWLNRFGVLAMSRLRKNGRDNKAPHGLEESAASIRGRLDAFPRILNCTEAQALRRWDGSFARNVRWALFATDANSADTAMTKRCSLRGTLQIRSKMYGKPSKKM